MRAEELRPLPIFDGLSDAQLEELAAGGEEVEIVPGQELFHEGGPADHWWVLIEGSIDLVRRTGREDTLVARMSEPGNWAGGFRAWDEQGSYLATARGAAPGRLLRVPAEVLRERSTAWFPFGSHLIRGVYRTARSIESTVRQRESLVTLGTLAAGLAHELNNPAAAAIRAVDSLDEACATMMTSLTRLAQAQITADQFSALDVLRQGVAGPDPGLDALARADREEALTDWLSDHGIIRAWSMAPALADAGIDIAWCERAAEVLPGEALRAAMEWVASTWSVSMLMTDVKESTGRISALVSSVRSYTQMDRASWQDIDLTDGLDSTLVMLGHQLKRGVSVVKEYDPEVPHIQAYAGELNQVWTNLISNAIDAMDGSGVLRIGIRVDGEDVVVEIGDTGSGMAPEVAERAFEAFYTTKDVGQGTGLGLDIARRIVVERHGGEITINSEPGNTVLAVRLPIAAKGER
jgi:signal transduction histidine kinase